MLWQRVRVPGHRFSVAALVRELSLPNEHSLRAFLGKTTVAAKRIGVSQDKPNSWFVLWEDRPEWKYWLDEQRAGWWTASGDWSRQELKASVDAYLQMLGHHRAGRAFVKKEYYRDLAKRFGRTEKSYEYRAQNISFILEVLGRDWLPGLVPARNVGPRVTAELEQLLAEAEGRQSTGAAKFEAEVRTVRTNKKLARPKGNRKPRTRTGSSTSYDRDP